MTYSNEQDYIEGKSIPEPNSGCWLWLGAVDKLGYANASTTRNKKYVYMSGHRRSYEAYIGPIPKGLHVLHRCDNPQCVNPEHLFLGTHQDNIRDMDDKGRRHSKVDKECADIIRFIYAGGGCTQQDISEVYGISQKQVSYILANKAWG